MMESGGGRGSGSRRGDLTFAAAATVTLVCVP